MVLEVNNRKDCSRITLPNINGHNTSSHSESLNRQVPGRHQVSIGCDDFWQGGQQRFKGVILTWACRPPHRGWAGRVRSIGVDLQKNRMLHGVTCQHIGHSRGGVVGVIVGVER